MVYYIPIILISIAGYFLHRRFNAPPVACFFIVLCFGAGFVWVLGAFNLLFAGMLLFYALCILFGCVQIVIDFKSKNFSAVSKFFTVPYVLLLISTFIFLAIYAYQNPLFHYWDEYSFWGTAAKQAHTTHFLPFVQNFGLNSFSNLPTGSSTLVFIFSAFNNTFNDYVHYYAYAVVMLAVFALLSEIIICKYKSGIGAISVFFLCTVCVFFQTTHPTWPDFSNQSYAYATAMVDFLIAIYAVGCVLLYFLVKDSALKYAYFVPAFLCCLTKNVGIVFALLSLCIIACFQIFAQNQNGSRVIFRFLPLILGGVFLFTLYIGYNSISSKIHFYQPPSSSVTLINGMLEHQAPQQQALPEQPLPEQSATFVQSIISPSLRSNRQAEVINDMALQFTNTKTTFFIYDFLLVLILIILGVVCIVFSKKSQRLALTICLLGIIISGLLYALAISYFIAQFSDGMVEYSRYMSTYYWIWLYLTIAMLASILIKRKKIFIITAFSAFLTACLFFMGTNKIFVASPQNHYMQAIQQKHEIAPYNNVLSTSPKVFLVSERYNDYTYMLDRYYLLPAYVNVDTNHTGFDFSKSFIEEKYLTPENESYYIVATDDEFLQIIAENFDYVFISYIEEEFKLSYSEHFKSELKINTMYKVVQGETVYFEEVHF